jgi:hypothetical protein
LIAVLSACGGGTSAIIAVIEIVTPLGGDWGAPLGNDDEDEYGDFPGVAVVGHDYPNFDRRDDELLFHVNACAWVSGFVPD